jgi:hypothetical protein
MRSGGNLLRLCCLLFSHQPKYSVEDEQNVRCPWYLCSPYYRVMKFLNIIIKIGQFLFSKSPVAIDKVIIIRHGEKADNGDNLSLQGLDRSRQLPGVLHQKFGIPDYVYVPALKLGKSTNTARMYQTIVPYAVKYNSMINTKYNVDDYVRLSGAIKTQRGTALVVWEHKAINNIVKALGVKEKLSWDDNDYDSIWIITYPNGVATINYDHQNIKPAANR